MTQKSSVRLAIIGDLLFTTPYASKSPARGLETLCPEIRTLFAQCDLVLANLESTLPSENLVASEPRVLGTDAQFDSLNQANINVVTLANNHAFDALAAGFRNTTSKLKQLEIHAFGAGENLSQAQSALSLTINGVRLAFVAAVAASTGMKTFADDDHAGVVPLQTERLCTQFQQLKKAHDHVIFTPHWGEERFRFPSPQQIEQAHAFIDAGASLILGHHPHVLQGSETYQQGFIAYSLGNFLSNPVYWQNGDFLSWDKFERTSQIIVIELEREKITAIEQIPIFDNGSQIDIEKSGWGEKCLQRADRFLQQEINASRYAKEAFRVNKVLPFKAQLQWNNLRHIRPGHIKKAIHLLLRKRP